MDASSALEQAGKEFVRRVESIADHDWTTPTVCDGWSVAQLVSHVCGGSRMASALIGGADRAEAIAVLESTAEGDPVDALKSALIDEAASFAKPDAMDLVVQHPSLDMSGAQLLGFRTLDLTLHAWDLSRSLGLDEQLDHELVESTWQFLQPLAPVIGQIGVFGQGPSGAVPEAAPLQTRLIDLTGRRP